MSRDAGIRVEGARRLRSTMREAGLELTDLKAAHAEAARTASARAAHLTPVRSGRLLSTVRSSGTTTAGILRAGTAAVPYAGPIHWGWPARGIPPHPFLSQGAQESEPDWLPVYEEAVDAALAKIKGK